MKSLRLIISTITISSFLLLFMVVPKVSAAEIDPSADSYSYGSTSEMSPYTAIPSDSDLASSLASTGENNKLISAAIVILLTAGGGVLAYTLRRQYGKKS